MYFIIAAESGLNNSVGAFVNAIFCIEWAAKRKVLLNLVEIRRRFVLGQVPLHFPEWQCETVSEGLSTYLAVKQTKQQSRNYDTTRGRDGAALTRTVHRPICMTWGGRA